MRGEKRYGGSFIAAHTYRYLSGWLCPILAKTSVTPTQVTFLAFSLGLAGIILLLSPSYPLLILACLLLVSQNVLDCVDGELARLTGKASARGALTDEFLDRTFETLLFLTLTWLAFLQTQAVWVWVVGFLAAMGNMRMISVHLKLEGLRYESRKIKTLPLWRQMMNYNGDFNVLIIIVAVLARQIHLALIMIALITNLHAFGRFFYVRDRLGVDA